ncbi:hypothetical protein N7528_000052 [Penicillium herquei]|nr:hypothetical protein N7528_000052 [Penicillium herquei]
MIDYANFFQFIKDKEGFKAVLGQTQSLALPVVSLSLADIWHVWIYTRENAPKRNPIMAEFLTKEGYKSLLRDGGGDSHDGTYTQWCKHGTYAIRVFHDVSLEQQLRIEWNTPRPLNLFFLVNLAGL